MKVSIFEAIGAVKHIHVEDTESSENLQIVIKYLQQQSEKLKENYK